jgi:hypothetical protein
MVQAAKKYIYLLEYLAIAVLKFDCEKAVFASYVAEGYIKLRLHCRLLTLIEKVNLCVTGTGS